MKPPTMAALWAKYRDGVIPRQATAIQIQETEKAFYAGAYVLLSTFVHIGAGDVSDDDGAAFLSAIERECETYVAQIMAATPDPPPSSDATYTDSNYTAPDPDGITPIMRDIAARIGNRLPPNWGFNLLLFSFGAKGNLFYISNAQRNDVIAVMREFIQRNEH